MNCESWIVLLLLLVTIDVWNILESLICDMCVVDYVYVEYLCIVDLIVHVDVLSVDVVTALLSVMLIIISDALL